jgi:hypothetical protein
MQAAFTSYRLVAALLALLTTSTSAQVPNSLRVALVIGNGAYEAAALATPANDAKAMSETLRGLGFTVVEARDATRVQMEAAILQAREAMKDGNAVGMLYYSGHALQLGWRNYMVPVDAKLSGSSEVAVHAIDVQRVVDAFKGSGNRMNIFVFDACRENPFSASASGRGLAQMDAPPESLLAYSTAPGEVADDRDAGNGHGLYTHHLLRELKQSGAKIEDVFKRVRFWVRRETQGRQVPWESTSLEGDFYFDPGFRAATRTDEDSQSEVAGMSQRMATPARVRIEPRSSDFMAEQTRFVGTFKPDRDGKAYSGTGKVLWPDGGSFEGTLVVGKREGRGTFYWSSGQRYEGEWKADQPNGQGIMWFANGEHFEGEFEAGEPTGQGRMRYPSGDRYVGLVLKGIPHGRGIYTWPSGQSLVGEWVDGKVSGSGTMRFANGNLYEGELAAGMPNGQGRMLFSSGESYSGTFRDGKPEGVGTYVWKDGARHVGQWKEGAQDGVGVMTWPNGDRWEGTFRGNAMLDGVLTRNSN